MLLSFENDEKGSHGEPCEQWLIRDADTDNDDVVAIVPRQATKSTTTESPIRQ